MRLRRVQVEHFRSIVDSSVVEIEERVTVLVGKNEQGKTTFLRALASLSPKVTYTQGDLPNHLRPALEERAPTDIPVVRVWLSLEPPDKVSFKDIVAGVDSFAEIKATRFFDGSRTYAGVATDGSETPLAFTSPNIDAPVDEIKKHAEALKAKFTAAVARLPTFAPALPQAESQVDQFMAAKFRTAEDIDNLIKVFSTGLASLPGQDAPIQEDISSAVKSIQCKSCSAIRSNYSSSICHISSFTARAWIRSLMK